MRRWRRVEASGGATGWRARDLRAGGRFAAVDDGDVDSGPGDEGLVRLRVEGDISVGEGCDWNFLEKR